MKDEGKIIITQNCGELVSMAYLGPDSWEIYYRKGNNPFVFAFGLPIEENAADVMKLAENNAENYLDLFE